ncbi:MAG: hypothetical protein HGA47_07335 [Zoogloea sp.]|nr:hypothetical protein [Zoogloea sp.]
MNDSAIAANYTGGCKAGFAEGQGQARGRDVYKGGFAGGIPHGYGTYTWANGSSYEGDFQDGRRHGFGTLILVKDDENLQLYGDRGRWSGNLYIVQGSWSNGRLVERCLSRAACKRENWIPDAHTGCLVYSPNPMPLETIEWSGQCRNGKAQGRGVLQWYNDGVKTDRYEGDYREGKKHGKGVYVWASGSRYQGAFVDGRREGFGTMTLAKNDPSVPSYGAMGKWEGEYFVARGMWSDSNLQFACQSAEQCEQRKHSEASRREHELQQIAAERAAERTKACERLKVGAAVNLNFHSCILGCVDYSRAAQIEKVSKTRGVVAARVTEKGDGGWYDHFGELVERQCSEL